MVTGPLRILEKNPKPITLKDLHRAVDVEPSIGKAMRAFLDQEKPKPLGEEPEEHDYQETLDLLTAQRSAQEELERRTLITSQLPEPMVAGEYSTFCDKVVGFLARNLPRRNYVTLTGHHQGEPSGCEMSAFWRAWEAIEDPRILLRDMSEGILVSDQVAVAREQYPMLYAVMTQQALLAMADRKAKDEDYEPAGWQERQIETLLQVSRLSPELAAELQARANRTESAQRAEETQPPQVQDKAIDALQTPVQRIANR